MLGVDASAGDVISGSFQSFVTTDFPRGARRHRGSVTARSALYGWPGLAPSPSAVRLPRPSRSVCITCLLF